MSTAEVEAGRTKALATIAPNQADLIHGANDALSTTRYGLTTSDAERRLAEVGRNEPASGHPSGVWPFIAFFLNPLVIILLASSLVMAALGDLLGAAIMAVLALLSIVLNFTQARRLQKSTDRLRIPVTPTAIVRRDGEWRETAHRSLRPEPPRATR